MLLDAYDAILSDLDGVVYAGPYAIAGAPEALNRATATGTPVAYITNNASRSVETVAEHLVQLGVETDASFVVSSAQAAAELLKDHIATGSKVLICGAQALADCVEAAGFLPVQSQNDQPVAVVQGFDPTLTWERLAEASYTLADRSVVWVASNTDFTIPKERGIAPGNGTLVKAVATATQRTPLVAGKPEAAIFSTGARKLNSVRPLVVGDRLDTDIQGGNRAGMDTAVVMTGVDTYESILAAVSIERPTYIVQTLNDFFTDYPSISVLHSDRGSRAEVEGWVATAEGKTLSVTGQGSDINFWRAATAAWWAEHPVADQPLEPEVFNRG